MSNRVKKRSERAVKRHRFLLSLLRFLCAWVFRLLLRFRYEKVKLDDSPYFIMLNHNSDFDPIFAGMVFKRFMYFVASEHVYRMGVFSKLIRYVFDPIIRMKGTTEARAAMEILRTARSGFNICIFAEGNRSFNGETGSVLASTGKLVRRSGAGLVTYVLRGDYFTTPRWGWGIRRGLVKGELAGIYTKEQVAAMSDDEINEIIVRDLYVNAFDDQRKLNVRYRGKLKNRAVGIENALYLCPLCENIGTIKSERDRFFCGCGLNMRYTEYGWLQTVGDVPAPFDNILEWDKWQVEKLRRKLTESDDADEAVFFDDSQILYEIKADYTMVELVKGRLSFFRDRIEMTGPSNSVVFTFEEIDDIEITGRMNINFSDSAGRSYEIRSAHSRAAAKYREGFRFLVRLKRSKQ